MYIDALRMADLAEVEISFPVIWYFSTLMLLMLIFEKHILNPVMLVLIG